MFRDLKLFAYVPHFGNWGRGNGASDLAQWVKRLASKLDSLNSVLGPRVEGEMVQASYHLAHECTHTHIQTPHIYIYNTHMYTHTYTHIHMHTLYIHTHR